MCIASTSLMVSLKAQEHSPFAMGRDKLLFLETIMDSPQTGSTETPQKTGWPSASSLLSAEQLVWLHTMFGSSAPAHSFSSAPNGATPVPQQEASTGEDGDTCSTCSSISVLW